MVMPERLPAPLPVAPEVPGSTVSAARVVAVPKVASAEFTAVSKRRSFTAKYKLQILAETDRAVETGGISAILRREGLYSSALSDWRGQREAGQRIAGGWPLTSAQICPQLGKTLARKVCHAARQRREDIMTDRRTMMLGLVAGMSGLAALSQVAVAEAAVSQAEAQGAIDSFLDALFSGDPARVDHGLAPGFQILRSDGKSYDKVSYLGALPNHKVRPSTSNLKATGYGDMIVTTYTIATEQTIGDQAVEAVSPRLSVFHKEGDRWMILAHANFAQIG
jgi:hypothetical protein